jgi:phage gp36-like protein
MFLTIEDYKAVIGNEQRDVVSQSSPQNLERAERYAIDEIKSYLRAAEPSKTGIRPYDVDAAFLKTGTDRNQQLVMYACDIALYHLVAWMPQRAGYEIREIRYRRALEWLEAVQQGKIILDIPLFPDDDTKPSGGIVWSSMDKSVYDW